MSEKVKLPKQICDALDVVSKGLSNYEIVFGCANMFFGEKYYANFKETVECLNEACEEDLMRALVLGYEPGITEENQIKDLYFLNIDFDTPYFRGFREGISNALRIHGIKYDWLDDDAE